MPSTLAYANPDVLRWARESSGFTVQEAAKKIGIRWSRLEQVEGGGDYLTLRQAEKAADAYERPLAALLAPSPPEEEPPEAQFRRLPGAPEPPWPPAMRLLARRVRERQQAAEELHELLEEPPPWTAASERLAGHERGDLASVARAVIGVSREEQAAWAGVRGSAGAYAFLRGWIDAVEQLGVVVMQDGSLGIETMRGFASIHPTLPAIVVNTQDDPRTRAFTVLHEFGHLLLTLNGIEAGAQAEAWCNDFAGEVLIPAEWLSELFSASASLDSVERVEDVAREAGVTPLAAAVRIRRAGLLPAGEGERVIAAIRARWKGGSRPGGGHYYRTTIAHLGPAYIRLVLTALDSGAVTYPTASTMLGNVKVNNFSALRETLERRSEMA